MQIGPTGRGALSTALVGLVGALALFAMLPGAWSFQVVDLPDDYMEQMVANLGFWKREFAAHRLPQWDPYRLGGMPSFGGLPCLSPLYPFGWLLPFLSLDSFVRLAWLSHIGLGLAGLYLFVRSEGHGHLAAACAAMVFATSTPPAAAIIDGQLDNLPFLALFPWALVGWAWASRRQDEARRQGQGERGGLLTTLRAGSGGVALTAIALGAIGLGAHTRFAAISFLALGTYALCRRLLAGRPGGASTLHWAATLTVTLLLGAMLAAPGMVPPFVEMLAARSPPPSDGTFPSGQVLSGPGLAGLLYPRALIIDQRWDHIGPGLLLALAVARRDRGLRALLVASALLLGIGMGAHGPLGLLVRPFHWLVFPVETGVASFSIYLLAPAIGIGLGRVGEEAPRGWLVVVLGIAAALSLRVAFVEDRGLYVAKLSAVHGLVRDSALHGAVALGALVLALLGLRLLAAAGRGRTWVLGLIVVVLAVDGGLYLRRVAGAIVAPEVRPTAWAAVPAVLEPIGAFQPGERVLDRTQRGQRSVPASLQRPWTAPGHGWGHDPATDPTEEIPRDWGRASASLVPPNAGSAGGWWDAGGQAKVPPMPWSVLIEWALSDRGENPLRTERGWARALEVMHVRWILSGPAGRPAAHQANPDPRPAALLSARVRLVVDGDAAGAVLFDSDEDLRGTAVVLRADFDAASTGGLIGALDGAARQAPARLAAWAPGAWTVQLPEPSGGVLTVAERYHPGWRASDGEGKRLATVPANLVQLGVLVPPGVDRVQLTFRTPGLSAALGLAALAALGLVLLRWGGAWRRSATADSRS